MDKEEIAIKLYDATVSQFLSRLRQRDAILLFYIASSGTIVGFSGGKIENSSGLLLIIPYFACACGLMMAYHSLFIEALLKYNHEFISLNLRESMTVFESSEIFSKMGMVAVYFRTFGYMVILIIPTIAALIMTKDISSLFGEHHNTVWWFSLTLGMFGIGAIVYADCYHIQKVKIRNNE